MKDLRKVSELPVMKSNCKTCPFKKESNSELRDPKLASDVTNRTLFKGQQICHGTEGKNRNANHRCVGSYEHNEAIYDSLGFHGVTTREPLSNIELKAKAAEWIKRRK